MVVQRYKYSQEESTELSELCHTLFSSKRYQRYKVI